MDELGQTTRAAQTTAHARVGAEWRTDIVERGLVLVRHKLSSHPVMGFLVQGAYIVTVAHFLPDSVSIKDLLPDDDPPVIDVLSLDGKPKAEAVVTFVDPCCDLAILSHCGSGGELHNTPDCVKVRFADLVAGMQSLPLSLEKLTAGDQKLHVRMIDKQWVSGAMRTDGRFGTRVTVGWDALVLAGMSGAPVFDDNGLIVGIMSSRTINRTGCIVRLPDALPHWLVIQAKNE